MDIKHLVSNDEERIFAIFAGRSGSGKTVAGASLPRPLEEIDCDLRANGLINAIRQGIVDDKDISITQIDPFKGYLELERHLNLLYTKITARQFNLKSIDIGSATSLIRLLNLSTLNLPQGTIGIGHINLAGLSMTGPADYKFESQAAHKIIDFLRVMPCNVTLSAHIIDRYGKAPNAKDTDPQVVIGEKLTLGTANLAENILAMFNDVYVFTKRIINNEDRYFVNFNTEMAKNTFGIPPGEHDITKKNFWEFFQKLVKSIKEGTFVSFDPKATKGGSFF
jgi:hypothetical protein